MYGERPMLPLGPIFDCDFGVTPDSFIKHRFDWPDDRRQWNALAIEIRDFYDK